MKEKRKLYLWRVSWSWTRASFSLWISLRVGRIATIAPWVGRVATITRWWARRSLKKRSMKIWLINKVLFYYIDFIHITETWWNHTGRHWGKESLKTKVIAFKIGQSIQKLVKRPKKHPTPSQKPNRLSRSSNWSRIPAGWHGRGNAANNKQAGSAGENG